MNTSLSKAQRDALERQDARYLTLPLSQDLNAVQAHLRHTVRLLKDRQTSSPSARAVGHLNGLFDRSIPAAAEKHLACRQGCAHCCRQPVVVYAPEIFFLAAYIRNREGMAQKVLSAGALAEGRKTQIADWFECPLLEDNSCSVYSARPLSCHAFVSLDVNDCLSAFRYMQEPKIQSPQVYNDQRNACRMILLAAMRALRLPAHAYELNGGVLAAVLSKDNAEKRWLRGEDVLGSFKTLPPSIPEQIEIEIARMAQAAAAFI